MASSAAPAAAAPGPLPRIAVAYDGSEHSALAATWAAQHLLRPGHKIVLVAVASGAPMAALAPSSLARAATPMQPLPAAALFTLPASP